MLIFHHKAHTDHRETNHYLDETAAALLVVVMGLVTIVLKGTKKVTVKPDNPVRKKIYAKEGR